MSADDRQAPDMSDLTPEDAAFLDALGRTQAEALAMAQQMIPTYPPFSIMPDEVNGRMIASYKQIADTQQMGKRELRALLEHDIPWYLKQLEPMQVRYPNINSARLMVLVHVAFVIGIRELLGMPYLWQAIGQNKFHEAARAIRLSKWPDAAMTEQDRRRFMDLEDILRDGTPPLEWMH